MALPAVAACSAAACCSRHHIERQARAWTKRKWGGHTAYSAVPCRGIIIVVDVDVDADVDVEVGSSARPTNLLFAYSKISLKIVYSLVWHEMKVSFGPQVNVLSNGQCSPRTPFCTLQKLNGDAAPFSKGAPSIDVCICVCVRKRERAINCASRDFVVVGEEFGNAFCMFNGRFEQRRGAVGCVGETFYVNYYLF